MLRSTPFLTEFAPLMVLKIYKWKTNLSQAAEVDQNRGQERGWQRNVFRMSWRVVWKKEAPSRKGGNLHKVSTASSELTPGYSYSCKKPSHEAHTQPGAKQLCF